ncbi:TIGR03032 family protein [Sediminicoccus sp. KRV36]|uniref:TIGR03032 family protein n=1 Tax=Sediminicoccus sp. KRV36 TaxID=3133721 RepID=UPI00200CCB0B|nr:TIGR03032 family protein [Sediminicoccus rosea]UPY37229.1 TIGR03032 family protein [Sediminicoccus rosea]
MEIHTSRQLAPFLAEHGASLAITTYQAGKLFLIGTKPDLSLSVFERTLERCMGLVASPNSLHISTLFQIWRFQRIVGDAAGHPYEGYDAVYAPRLSWVTGDLDAHDMALLPDGRPVFANTLFSCLATVSDQHNFTPLWRPPFISRLAAEDRCHMNGLAMQDGAPKYVTLVGQSDVADGWREHRRDGGCVIDVASGEVVVSGLSMPHSPRVHRSQLYVLNAGTGELGRVDVTRGRFEPIAFCPGFLRGLTFLGDCAVVGTSMPRDNRTFTGLALDSELARRNAEPRCAILFIDLRTGDTVHWLRFEGMVQELYDVAVLEGVRRPAALGFKSSEIRRMISLPE